MTQEKNTQRIENVSTEQQQAIILARQETDAMLQELSNKPQYNRQTASTQYRLSNHTGEWIRIYKAIGQIWEDISNIIWVECGNDVDRCMEKYFEPHLSELLDAVLKRGVAESIAETIGTAKDKSLI